MRTAEIWKKYIFSFSESIFIIKSGGLINLSDYIGVFARLKGRVFALCVYNLLDGVTVLPFFA